MNNLIKTWRGPRRSVLVFAVLVVFSALPLRAGSTLPFEATFSDYLKGSWKVANGNEAWHSGPISIEGRRGIAVSFDANQKGRSTDAKDHLKVWLELDGVPMAEPLLHETGSFKGREVRHTVTGTYRTVEVKVEARSATSAVQYLVDNVRVESPETGEVVNHLPIVLTPTPPLPATDIVSGVVRYPRLPGHVESGTFALVVNDVSIPVEEMWGDPAMVIDPTAVDFKVAVARFAYNPEAGGRVRIRVRATTMIDSITISPRNPSDYGRSGPPVYRDLSIAGDAATFLIDQPRHLMVKVNALEYLLLLIDKPEHDMPQTTDADVVDLADFLPPNRDQNVEVTAAFQRAINATAAEGKILYVPDGLYACGQLVFPSEARIYLASGALVRSIPEWTPKLWPPHSGPADTGGDSAFIFVGSPATETDRPGVQAVKNVHLYGRGVIDGNGWNMRLRNDSSIVTANVKLFRSARAQNLVVEDVYFRDSARWSFNVLLSESVRFSNVKLINCMIGFQGNWTNDQHFKPDVAPETLFHIPLVTNLDGYDIDASTDVVVEDGLVFTGDDAFTPKVTGYLGLAGPCQNLVFRRNLIWTEKAALKIGSEVRDDIVNVVFEDNDIVRADRFLSVLIDGKPGVEIANAHLRDNRIEQIGGNAYERFFRFKLSHEGAIRSVFVSGVDALASAPQFSSGEGIDDRSSVGPVRLRDIRVGGQPQSLNDLFGPNPLLHYTDVEVLSTAQAATATDDVFPDGGSSLLPSLLRQSSF